MRWSAAEPSHRLDVEAVPRAQPWRPALRTPRPRVAGVHSAVVTGPAGSEIHADAAGCVRVRFPWDREGPVDDGSSLPVRVAQPNMPGSMLLPRVGWEVLVAFEDGDPDRPFIVGRVYNARSPPPFGLPANRTITSLATSSSPGGACQSSVHFDDAAGRQHMAWNAGFGKTTTVGNDMATQTVGNEVCKIGGSETVSIGGADKLSVTQPYVVDIGGAQHANVGGSQTLTVHGDMGVTTGAESVSIGGALIEQVGDPVAGLKGLATSAAMELVGSLPKVGAIAGALGGVAMAAIQGYQQGGLDGAASAAAYGAAKAAVGVAAGMFPGADAAVAAVEGTGQAPWTPPQQVDASKAAAGGGAAGPSAAGDAGGGGGGQRVTKVDASMSQLIGAMHVQATPGSVKTTVLGPTTRLVGGDHNVRAVRVSTRTMGASVDTLGSLDIVAGKAVSHSAKGAHGCTVAGGLTSKSGGPTVIAAEGPLEVTAGGALSLKGGGVLLECGGSMVVIAGGGVLLKASTVTIDGKVVDGGKGTTP
ncbi:MAG: type VI secretion system tip protein VgrG [Polyangiaceae bacterium]